MPLENKRNFLEVPGDVVEREVVAVERPLQHGRDVRDGSVEDGPLEGVRARIRDGHEERVVEVERPPLGRPEREQRRVAPGRRHLGPGRQGAGQIEAVHVEPEQVPIPGHRSHRRLTQARGGGVERVPEQVARVGHRPAAHAQLVALEAQVGAVLAHVRHSPGRQAPAGAFGDVAREDELHLLVAGDGLELERHLHRGADDGQVDAACLESFGVGDNPCFAFCAKIQPAIDRHYWVPSGISRTAKRSAFS